MIKKLILSSCFWILLQSMLVGQDNEQTYSKWYFKPSIGFHIPLTSLKKDFITDDLINYNNLTNAYGQALSVNYFINANWGIEMMSQTILTDNYQKRNDRFNTNLDLLFSHDYFLDINPAPISESTLLNILLGVAYRYERKPFVFQPRLLVGSTGLAINFRTIELKQKGTNNILNLTYEVGDTSSSSRAETNNFTTALGFTFAYRITKRWLIQIEGMYSYYQFNETIFETIENTFTSQSNSKSFAYRKNMHNLSIGLGVIIEVKSFRKK